MKVQINIHPQETICKTYHRGTLTECSLCLLVSEYRFLGSRNLGTLNKLTISITVIVLATQPGG